jgi:hypothetical protein
MDGFAREKKRIDEEPACLPADNELDQLLSIPEPRPTNLRGADFRHNLITDFKAVASQLSSFENLRDLALDNNRITSAVGLAALPHLLHVSLTSNQFTHCVGLGALTVRCSSHLEPSYRPACGGYFSCPVYRASLHLRSDCYSNPVSSFHLECVRCMIVFWKMSRNPRNSVSRSSAGL